MLKLNTHMPPALNQSTLKSEDGSEYTIESIIKDSPALLVFIRHFGCFSCATQLSELSPRLNQIAKMGIKVLAIGNGEAQYINDFKDRLMLNQKPIEIYTDPTLTSFKAAGLDRSAWKVLSPVTMWQYLKALAKGIKMEEQQGDSLQLGGTLFIDENGIIKYYFQDKNVAAYADQNQVMDAIQKYVLTNQLLKK